MAGNLALAYLRIQADAKGLPEEVEAESAKAGAAGAKAFNKAFQEEATGIKTVSNEKEAAAAGAAQGKKYAASFKSAINKVGKISAVAIVAGLGAATYEAAKFQTGLTRLVTSAGEAQSNLAKVSAGVLQVAVATGTSTSALTTALYTIDSAGFHAGDSLKILTASAKGARSENADLKDVADAVTTALKDYNLSANDSTRVTNTYIAAVSHGKTTFQEFTSSLSTVQALAAAAHIKLADLTGVLATLTDHGVSAQEATQQMAFAIRNLQAPNNQAVQAMEQLGISSVDVSKNLGSRGLGGTIEYLSEQILKHMGKNGLVLQDAMNKSKLAAQDATIALGKLPPQAANVAKAFSNGSITLAQYRVDLKALPADQAALVQQYVAMANKANGFNQQLKNGSSASKTYTAELGKILGGANGLQVALQLGSDGFVTLKKNTDATTKAYNSNSKQVSGFAEVQKTFNFQLSSAKETFETLGITIGSKVLPPLTTFFKGLTEHKTVLDGVIKAAGILGTTLATIWVAGKIAAGIKAVIIAFKALKAATEADTVAQWALNVAEYANPIGLIVLAVIAAIALLAVAVYEIYKHWKGFSGFFKGLWQDMYNYFFGPIWRAMLWLYHNVIDPVWQAIVKVFNAAKAIIISAAKEIGGIFSWLWNNIIHPIYTVWVVVTQIIMKVCEIVFKSIELLFIVLWRGIMVVWNAVGKPLFDAFMDKLKILEAGFVYLWKKVIVPVWDYIWGHIKAGWDTANKNIFQPLINMITKDVPKGFDVAVKAVVKIWNTIVDGLKVPIRIVVNDVLNGGLIKAFNTVDKALGSPVSPIKNIDLPKGFATGGPFRGAGNGTSDSNVIRISNGEFIMPASKTAMYYPLLESMRQGMFPGFKDGGLFGFISGLGNLLSDPVSVMKNGVNKLIDTIPGKGFVSDLSKGEGHKLVDTVADWLSGKVSAKIPGASSLNFAYNNPENRFNGGGSLMSWVLQAMAIDHVSGSNWLNGILTIISRESGGNPNAINLWDSNAAAGDPSRGLMQVIGSTFAAYHAPGTSSNIYDPVANIAAAVRYILSRYGDISHVQQANPSLPPMGYAGGGLVGANGAGHHIEVNLNGSHLSPGEQIAYLGTRISHELRKV